MVEEKIDKKFAEVDKTDKVEKLGWGARHIQMACTCMCVTALLMVRSSMAVAVLAMSKHNATDDDGTSENTSEDIDNSTDITNGTIEIYNFTSGYVEESYATFDWDKDTQSLILSSFFWGYFAMQLPAGMLAKRFGGKPVLLFAQLANAVVCLTVPMLVSVGGWQLVCAARLVIGLSQAFTFPACHTLIGRWLPDQERVYLSGLVYSGTQIGTILGMPISGFLAATSIGWPLIFYGMAALMFCTAAIWYWLTASSPEEHRMMTPREKEYIERGLNLEGEKTMRPPWKQIIKCPAVWALTAGHIGSAYGFVLFFVDTPTYLEKGLKISLKNSAVLSALPYIGMWIGTVLSTGIFSRLYNKGILSAVACRKTANSIGAIGISIGLIAMAYVGKGDTTLAVVYLVLAVTFSGAYMAGFMMNHLELSPNYAGVLMSLTNFIANIGSVVSPILTGYLLNNDAKNLSGWRAVFLVAAGISLSTNLFYVLFGSSDQQPWDNPNFALKQDDAEEMRPMNVEKVKEVPEKK